MSKQSETVRKGYTKIAYKYHKQRGRYPNKELMDRFLKHVPKNSKILDLGCGAGVPVSKFLARKGNKVTGIDFAKGMVRLAKKNVPDARFFCRDMTKMKFKANSFDAAVSFYAIIHVPREKHAKVYKDLHRILKPDTVMLVNSCGCGDWVGYSKNYLGVEMCWSYYGPQKTLEIIKKAGFYIIWSKILKLGGEKQFWVLAKNKK